MKPVSITIAKFCQISGLGRTTAFAMCKSGRLTRIYQGKRALVTMASVEAWLEDATAEAANQPARN